MPLAVTAQKKNDQKKIEESNNEEVETLLIIGFLEGVNIFWQNV
jgi:hypothetical protein